MAKPEWGVKRTCLSCAARFYDLGRTPIICPSCGAEFDLAALGKTRRAKPEKAAPAAAPAAAPEVGLVDEDETEVAASSADALAHSEDDDEDAAAPTPARKTGTEDTGDEDLGEFDADPLIDDESDDEFEALPDSDDSEDTV